MVSVLCWAWNCWWFQALDAAVFVHGGVLLLPCSGMEGSAVQCCVAGCVDAAVVLLAGVGLW